MVSKSPIDNPTNNLVPISRFWACVFVNSIFALLWTQKMKITRKWIWYMVVILSLDIFGIVGSGLVAIELIDNLSILSFVLSIILIYLMFKWTTQYNLENFGYESKKEWEKYN